MSVTIKKREFKTKGNIRRRKDDDDEDDEGGEGGKTEDIKRSALEQIREEQRLRKAQAGLAAVSTLEDVTSSTRDTPKKSKDGDDEEEEEVQQQSISEMMDANFTGIHYRTHKNEVAHKKIMEEYIKERMGQGKKKDEGAGEEPQEGGNLTKRDKLVKILEEIRVAPGDDTEKGEGGVGEGAPIAWNTGIAEVALPIEFKLKNIEATERARERLESDQGARKYGERSDEVAGNWSTNFKKHQRDYAIEMRERDRARGFGSGGGGRFADGPSGRDAMSDDAVYERFKKRVRR